MLVGAGSSHFVAVANVLRVAKGFLTAPVYLDAEQLVDGSHSVGLLHMANLREGQVAEKVCRRAAVALALACKHLHDWCRLACLVPAVRSP